MTLTWYLIFMIGGGSSAAPPSQSAIDQWSKEQCVANARSMIDGYKKLHPEAWNVSAMCVAKLENEVVVVAP